MKRILFFVLFISMGTVGLAQDSTTAKSLLDEVYDKVQGYDNIFVDFKYSLQNVDTNTNTETKGDVTMQGDKYLFNYMGSKQLYDGEKVYTVVPENEEVTIEKKMDEANSITPSKMLTFYKKGHNYDWDILQNIRGRKIQFVKLTPTDTNSEIKSVLLGIDVETKHIYKLIETGKNGTKTTITVNSFKTDQPLSKTLFTFDENKYKNDGYYIIRN